MNKRTERIRIRVSREELDHLKKCCNSFKKAKFQNGNDNFSEYIRIKLLAESGYKNKILEQQLREMNYELRKIGTNINQIAKKFNSGYGTRQDLDELKGYVSIIEQIFEDYKKDVNDRWQSQS